MFPQKRTDGNNATRPQIKKLTGVNDSSWSARLWGKIWFKKSLAAVSVLIRFILRYRGRALLSCVSEVGVSSATAYYKKHTPPAEPSLKLVATPLWSGCVGWLSSFRAVLLAHGDEFSVALLPCKHFHYYISSFRIFLYPYRPLFILVARAFFEK